MDKLIEHTQNSHLVQFVQFVWVDFITKIENLENAALDIFPYAATGYLFFVIIRIAIARDKYRNKGSYPEYAHARRVCKQSFKKLGIFTALFIFIKSMDYFSSHGYEFAVEIIYYGLCAAYILKVIISKWKQRKGYKRRSIFVE